MKIARDSRLGSEKIMIYQWLQIVLVRFINNCIRLAFI